MSALSAERFFRDLCESMSVALVATDADLNVVHWNERAAEFFGGSAEEYRGRHLTRIVPEDRRDLALRIFRRALQQRQPSEFEFRHRTPQGRWLLLAVTVSPVIDSEDRVVGTTAVARDIMAYVEREHGSANSRKMASLSAMAGAVAHHFNNYLGGIITSIDFANTSDDPELLRRTLRMTATALGRANQLTMRLRAFAEGDRAHAPPEELTRTIERFFDELRPRLTEPRISLDCDLDAIDVPAPARRIITVLENVTQNAIDAMIQGGHLQVDLKRDPAERQIVLRIADSGPGVAQEHLHHVFEPFFTTKNTIAGEHPGLGLAVVHGIVRDLGGNVTLASGEGGGAICTIRLPDTLRCS